MFQLGTPQSLNLRNIMWHGFSSLPNFPYSSYESSLIFLSTIYILLRHVGKKIEMLKETSFPDFHVQWRPKHSLQRVDKIFGTLGSDKLKNVMNKLEFEVIQRLKDLENDKRLSFMATKQRIIEVG